LLGRTGVVVAAAYGNALTDVCAYAEAGIPPARTFIIGPHAGAACDRSSVTQAVRTYPRTWSTPGGGCSRDADADAPRGASGPQPQPP